MTFRRNILGLYGRGMEIITAPTLAVLPITVSLVLMVAALHPDPAVRERSLRALAAIFDRKE